MYTIQHCPCCGCLDSEATPAVVAPFLLEYALRGTQATCRLMECRKCAFRFFDTRLDDAEIHRLYEGYRGETYFNVRNRHEFWYTRKVNADLGEDPQILDGRRNSLTAFLSAHLDLAALDSVLDYGGDKGQLLPEGIGKQKYVFDISGLESVSGVERITDAKALGGMGFDLVILSHILEHCSEPGQMLQEVKPLGKNGGSMLYVEVPYERYNLRLTGGGNLYGGYLRWLMNIPFLARILDFYSTAFRVKFNFIPPLGFAKLHEHINFFEVDSLRRLLERGGFEVIACERRPFASTIGSVEVICALARMGNELEDPMEKNGHSEKQTAGLP